MHLKVVDMLMTKLVLWIIRTHKTFMTAVTILSLPQMSMYQSLIIFNNQKHPHNHLLPDTLSYPHKHPSSRELRYPYLHSLTLRLWLPRTLFRNRCRHSEVKRSAKTFLMRYRGSSQR